MGLEKEGCGALKGKFGEGGVERKEFLGEIAMCCSHCLRRRHRLILSIWDWDLGINEVQYDQDYWRLSF